MLSKLYKKKWLPYLLICIVVIASTILLWLPFISKTPSINGIDTPDLNFETVLKQWDGALYIIPAKTFYDIDHPLIIYSVLGLDKKYFAAHLPLYPITLRFFAPFVGYPKATLLSTLLTSVFLLSFFYYFVKKLDLSKYPLALALVFAFFTPRFFVVRSVGSPEPLFILLTLMSVFYFLKRRFLLAGLTGALAVITKTPGILLFFAYGATLAVQYIKSKRFEKGWLWLALIPLGLLSVFILYHFQYGDFFAYFHSGNNLHLTFPPFSVFNFQKIWVGTGWLEDIMFVYFFYLMSILFLFPFALKSSKDIKNSVSSISFWFISIFFLSLILVQHRDIGRYSLPMLPFALIAFERFFTSKKFAVTLLLLIPALYLYSWNFMLVNKAPITEWVPFL